MIEYARLITKSSEGPPTIPPSASHDNGDWSSNDIYEHELYMDSLTGYTYTRQGDAIVLLSTGEGFSKWIEIDVLNKGADPLPKMAVCYFKTSSSSANTPEVLLADNSSEATSSKTMGLLKDTIAPNETGKLILVGEYNAFDTSAYNVGDRLWLGTLGGIVTTPPVAPRHAVFLGIVSRSHHTQGRICVSIQNGFELDELHNVSITTPVTNQGLFYNSVTGLWENKTVASAIGYTPVPETRTLTINGVTQDLSANRTFTISTGITIGTTAIASGVVGRVLFEGAGNVVQESSSLFWDATNNRLGIGTSTPATNKSLDIRFDIGSFSAGAGVGIRNINSQGYTELVFDNDTTPTTSGAFVFGYAGTGTLISNTAYFFQRRNASILFGTNDTERLRINGTGNVLIGTTTDAGFRLDVNGTARVQSGFQANGIVAFGTSNGFYWDSTNQRLGIGTNAPQVVLHIQTGTSEKLRLETNGTIGNFVSFYNSGVRKGYLGRSSSNDDLVYFNESSTGNLIFGANSLERLRIFSTGNIGINTTTDAGFRLDVNGTARVSGALTIGTELYLGNNNTGFFKSTNDFNFYNLANGSVKYRITGASQGFGISDNGYDTVAASAMLQVNSTTKGFLPPRMTTTQKNAIASPAEGLMVYDTTLNVISYYNGTMWI